MTQIGESISLSILSHDQHDEKTCAFCNATPEPTEEENELKDHFDEDENEIPGVDDDGIEHKNSSGKLAKDLEAKHFPKITSEIPLAEFGQLLPTKFNQPFKVTTAAHHLIPGNASLAKSDIMEYLHTDGMAKGNIGYNINNYENGVWLAGNYALRGKKGMPKWGKEGADFQKDTDLPPYEYAKRAIQKTKTQFHDAHEPYSELVIKTLDLIAEKFDTTQDVWCTESSKKKDDTPPQLPMLVMRLNTISRRLKAKLINPSKAWSKEVYTSRFSQQFIKDEIFK